ncbi:hypothetical protein [Pseudonocardia sp.]|uniref:hypothetical protein n=1 Tax=Pseudonocardia sp. TaxID=60912 RepID=UPI002630E2A1|nr:hypothetical protein [Pseudonocardia sp.]
MVLGGLGRYAAATVRLGGLLADPATPAAVAAHAGVTLASLRRQQGGHAAARALDGAALRRAVTAGGPDRTDADRTDADGTDADGTDALAARVDALVGLAADALGLGDPLAAERLLRAAAALPHPSWRLRVRAGWVRAELALCAGPAAGAVAPAEAALAGAEAAGSVRHVLKSRLVLAVARAVTRPNGRELAELDAVADAAAVAGLLPLVWPARLAAADLLDRMSPSVSISSPSANDERGKAPYESVNGGSSGAARRRHAAAVTVTDLYQLSDPMGRGLMGESVWVPARLPLL